MRRLTALATLAVFALALIGTPITQAQDSWTEADMAEFQARAEGYYEAGIDTNYMLGKDRLTFDEIKPGMIAPDFTLLDLEGTQHSLSDYIGEKFILLVTGSWY